MVGASFLTFIWIALGEVTAVFVVLMIWKSVTGVPEENLRNPRCRTDAARQPTSGHCCESRASGAVGEILRFRFTRVVADQRRRLGVSWHSRRQRRAHAVKGSGSRTGMSWLLQW